MDTVGTISKIIKRNGKVEVFNPDKIRTAIFKAATATGEFDEQMAHKMTVRVVNIAQQMFVNNPTVEQIQDIVEDVLLASHYKKTTKAYIIYREQHAQMRQIISKFNTDLVDRYLNKEDWLINENSNMAFSLQGLNHYISSEVSKAYWLNKIYPPAIREAHSSGSIHIHDLGLLSVYCVGWD